MYVSFRRRLTGGYVVLALALILLVVATSTALAFVLYAHSVGDSISSLSQRVVQQAGDAQAQHKTLADVAPAIVRGGHSRFHIRVYDNAHRLLARSDVPERSTFGRGVAVAFGNAIGLPHVRVPVAGGEVTILADFDRFGRTLLWYWSIMIPVGVFAVLLAWLIGRRITARATGPLIDVTQALQTIAAGNLAPERLLRDPGELRELTNAYNQVAMRLGAASAERAQTEAHMRQFIADAGHELRTPLTVIMGYLDLLRAGGVRDAAASERVFESMQEESRRMRALIERLILLARLDRTGTQPRRDDIDVSELVRRAAQSVEPAAADGRVRVDAAAQQRITGDETEIYEAIKNIIDNAVKYAPGSPVDVSVGTRDGFVCVDVRDRGPGMEPQDREHAFDRFYRGGAKYDVEGSGLGLAIAKGAVERAGGSIDLESTPGEGTHVTLRFPK